MNPISSFVSTVSYFLFMGILILNIVQKKSGSRGIRKRTATLYWGIGALAVYLGAGAIIHSPRLFRITLPDFLILPITVGVGGILAYYKNHTFPFRRTCVHCEGGLSLIQMLFSDANLCAACEKPKDK